jgi:hypothetical protein
VIITYRGDCEELYGRQIGVPDHECIEHLEYREESYRDRHGFDFGPYEEWTEHWRECTVCGDRFTDEELDCMQEQSA